MDKKCKHDVNSLETTIKIFATRFLVYPEYIHGVCTCCGKTFKYTKNQSDNKLKAVKGGKK